MHYRLTKSARRPLWWFLAAALLLLGAQIVWPLIPSRAVPESIFPGYEARYQAFAHTESDTRGRGEISCSRFSGRRAIVLLALGQSNAANADEVRFGPTHGVGNFNFQDGKCYEAKDPLLGATGHFGSIWIPAAQHLIASGTADSVLIVPASVGSARIAAFAPGGRFYSRIERTLAAIAAAHLTITDAVIVHGEADSGPDASVERYLSSLKSLIEALRKMGVSAPVIAAISTGCGSTPSPALEAVRHNIGAIGPRVYLGPDFNAYQRRFRECHLFEKDQISAGRSIAKAIMSAHFQKLIVGAESEKQHGVSQTN